MLLIFIFCFKIRRSKPKLQLLIIITENEKSIVSLLLALTQKVYALSEGELATNRLLSQLPILDEKLRADLRARVAFCESQLDQGLALLNEMLAFSKRS